MTLDDELDDMGCMMKIEAFKNLTNATYDLLDTLSEEENIPADGKILVRRISSSRLNNLNSSRAEPKILLGSRCHHPQNRNRGLTSKIAKRLKNRNSSSLSFSLCYHHKINLNPNPPQFYNKDPFVHTLLQFFSRFFST